MSTTAPHDTGLLLVAAVPSTLWAFYRHLPTAAQARGMRVGVAASDGPELDYFRDEYGCEAFTIPMPRAVSPLQDMRSIAQLSAVIRGRRYDIVHAFTPKAGLVGMLAARLTQTPARVYTIAGLPVETATGLTRHLLLTSERTACCSAHRVLVVSRSLMEVARSLRICAPPKALVLGEGTCCGVDMERFTATPQTTTQGRLKRTELAIPEDALVIGFVGRLVHDKGIHTLVDAFEKVLQRLPQVFLLLLGDYEPHRGEVPAHTIRTIDSHPRIRHAPFDWNPVPYYAAMDVLTLPTLREGFPYAVLEAASMGLPAVATRATGCVDAVVDGQTGLLVNLHDARALADALTRVLTDDALRRRMGVAARARVEQHFSQQHLLDGHLDLYESLLEQNRRVR